MSRGAPEWRAVSLGAVKRRYWAGVRCGLCCWPGQGIGEYAALVIATACTLLALAGCATGRGVTATPLGADRTGREDAAINVAVRYELPDEAWAAQVRLTACYVRVRGADPDAQWLAQFGDCGVPIRPASAAVISAEGVFDRESGKPGILVFVRQVRWITPQRVEVQAGYFTSGTSAQFETLILELRSDKWVVVQVTVDAVS
jgi:hypothetical protein